MGVYWCYAICVPKRPKQIADRRVGPNFVIFQVTALKNTTVSIHHGKLLRSGKNCSAYHGSFASLSLPLAISNSMHFQFDANAQVLGNFLQCAATSPIFNPKQIISRLK